MLNKVKTKALISVGAVAATSFILMMGYTVGQHSTVKQSRKEIELAAAKLVEDKQTEDKASILSSDTVLVPQIKEEIRQIASPMDAALEGRNRQNPLRPDWEEVKDEVMLQALRMKFSQNPEIAKELLATGDAILIEHTQNDDYWADGRDITGKKQARPSLNVSKGRVEKPHSVTSPLAIPLNTLGLV